MRSARVCALIKAVEEALCGVGSATAFCALSGGADSVSLLLAALECGCRVEALHCNFGLRGHESRRDEEFVRALCRARQVPLRCVSFDVKARMAEHPGESVEMACRELRYQWFAEVIRLAPEGSVLLTGHNLDDNVETFFLNLMRGAGLKGLGGIPSERGFIRRPLLSISKKEILGFLAERRQSFVVDSSNLASEYSRNFVRNEVVPVLERRWPGAKDAIERSRSILSDESLLLQELLADLQSASELSLERIKSSRAPLSLIYHFICHRGGSRVAAGEMLRSVESDSLPGKRWVLSSGVVVKERGALCFYSAECRPQLLPLEWRGPVKATSQLLKALKTTRAEIFVTSGKPEDYELREARRADRMTLMGMHGSRLLSDIVKDAKWDSVRKAALRVLVRKADGKIAWAEGLRRSALDAVSEGEMCFVAGSGNRVDDFLNGIDSGDAVADQSEKH